MSRLVATAILLLAAHAAATAPSVPVVTAECRDFPVLGLYMVPTTAPLSAGDTLLVAVGGDSHQIDGIRVQLGSQPLARVAAGVRAQANRDAIVVFVHRLGAAAAAGSLLTVRVDEHSPQTTLCTQAVVLPRIDVPYVVRDTARAMGSGPAITVASSIALDNARVVVASWFSATAEPFSSDATILGSHCFLSQAPCMVLTEREPASGVSSITVTPAAPQAASGVLVALEDPRLFSDGFE